MIRSNGTPLKKISRVENGNDNAGLLSQKEHEFLARLLQVLSDMERISDYCENISEYAETLVEKKLTFSEVGKSGLREMLTTCANSFYYAIEAL